MYYRAAVVFMTAVFFISSCAEINIFSGNTPTTSSPPVNTNYMVLMDYGLMVMKKDLGKSTRSGGSDMCKQIRLGGFSDWRLPTQGELAILYNERNVIGGFDALNNTKYWSSTPSGAGGFYVCLNFTNGSIGSHLDMSNQQALAVRCVRSTR